MKLHGQNRRSPYWIVRAYYWLANRFYHELAWLFDTCTKVLTFGGISRWRRLALKYLPDSRVLDVGCGTGDLLLELSSSTIEVFGLDFSTGMQKVMAKKVQRRGMNIPFILGSAHRQPFVSGWFHAVVTTFPSDFVTDPEVIEDIARIVRPVNGTQPPNSGRLVVVGMCLCSNNPLVHKILCALYNSSPERLLESFANLVKEVGFNVVTFMHGTGIFRVPVIVAEKLG